MNNEETIKNAQLALDAKRRRINSEQLEGEAKKLFINKKPFELQEIIRGDVEIDTKDLEDKIFDPNK